MMIEQSLPGADLATAQRTLADVVAASGRLDNRD
jgi:hypothetical protein